MRCRLEAHWRRSELSPPRSAPHHCSPAPLSRSAPPATPVILLHLLLGHSSLGMQGYPMESSTEPSAHHPPSWCIFFWGVTPLCSGALAMLFMMTHTAQRNTALDGAQLRNHRVAHDQQHLNKRLAHLTVSPVLTLLLLPPNKHTADMSRLIACPTSYLSPKQTRENETECLLV